MTRSGAILFLIASLAAIQSAKLDGSEKDALLNGVNNMRAQLSNGQVFNQPPPVNQLRPLQWSDGLAGKADYWASKCTFYRRDTRNMFLRSEVSVLLHNTSATDALRAWQMEADTYDWYNLHHIESITRNYTAIINENATFIGCASVDCPDGRHFRCLIDPKGNWPGLAPYKPACTPGSFSCEGKCGNLRDDNNCTKRLCPPCEAQQNSTQKRNACLTAGDCFSTLIYQRGQPVVGFASKDMTRVSCLTYCRSQAKTYSGIFGGQYCYCFSWLDDTYKGATTPVPVDRCTSRCSDGLPCGDSSGYYFSVDQSANCLNGAPVPDVTKEYFNWGINNFYVTPVKNQGSCGSCWAHTAVTLLETFWAFKTNTKAVPMSVQQIVDCAGRACTGGFASAAYDSINQMGGIERDSNWPYLSPPYSYTPPPGACKALSSSAFRMGNIGTDYPCYLSYGDPSFIYNALKKGPVGINYFMWNKAYSYTSGVFDDVDWDDFTAQFGYEPTINHAMVVEGFGVDPKTAIPYWLVRNSWGTQWGINGYFKIKRAARPVGWMQVCSQPIIP